jgi:menaquinone-dependent protoporphyrinogen oxidase
MRIYYASRDGQARRIAERLAERVRAQGIDVAAADLAAGLPAPDALAQAPLCAAVMAVRYGRHLPEALRFVDLFRSLADPPPLALASVNLTARKPGKDAAEGNAYLRKMIEQNGLRPVLAAAFAGRVDYPRYGFLDRQAIRLIMLMTGGPTDPRAVVEYTRWDQVDAFADRMAELCQGGAPPEA